MDLVPKISEKKNEEIREDAKMKGEVAWMGSKNEEEKGVKV